MSETKTRNYLIIIGMDLSSEPTTVSVQAALEKAHGKWNALRNKNNYYMELCDEYKDATSFAQDQQKIDAAYREAKATIDGFLGEALKEATQILGSQTLDKSELLRLEKRVNKKINRANSSRDYTLTDDYVLSFSKGMGITWTESSTTAKPSNDHAEEKAVAERYIKRKDEYKAFDTASRVKDALTNQGFKDLFDFACPPGKRDGRLASNQELLAQAQAKKAAQKNPKAQVTADMASLEKEAEIVFASDQSREVYEGYLRWLELTEYLKDTMQSYVDLEVPVKVEDQRRIEEDLAKMGLDKPSDAHALLVGYCATKKPKPIVLEGATAAPTTQWCYCGSANDKNAEFCHGCGMPLKVKCPGCGKILANSVDRCPSCGAPIGVALKGANEACEDARFHIKSLNLDAAAQSLETAKKYWTGFNAIAPLEQELKAKQAAMGDKVRQLRQAMDRREYFSAKSKLAQILAGASATGPLLAQQTAIEQACDDAKDLVAQARTATGAQRDQLMCDAYSIAHDQPQARDYVQKTPPLAVAAVEVIAGNDAARVSWRRPNCGGELVYYVVRKEGSKPLGLGDGTTLTSEPINSTSFLDKDMPQGIDVYYGVVVSRFDNTSAMTVSAPCIKLGRLEGFEVLPGDGAIDFSWKPISPYAHVVIADERGRQLARTQASHYTVGHLTNGTTYCYQVSLVYDTGGKERMPEPPRKIAATPIDAENYVFSLASRRVKNQQGVFELNWEKEGGTTLFFSTMDSSKVPEAGTVTTLGELQNTFSPVSTTGQTDTACKVMYSGDEVLCVFAASVFGQSAIVGQSVRLSNIQAINLDEPFVDRDHLAMQAKPPKRFTSIVVLSRPDRFVRSLQETGPEVSRDITTAEAFEETGLVRGPKVQPRLYYLSVFVVLGRGAEAQSTEPVELMFDNTPKRTIQYQLEVQKKLFGKGKLRVTFSSSDGSDFELPAATIRYCRGRVPHMSEGAYEVAQIPPRHVNGAWSIEIDPPKVDNTFAEVFAADGSEGPFECTSSYKVS